MAKSNVEPRKLICKVGKDFDYQRTIFMMVSINSD